MTFDDLLKVAGEHQRAGRFAEAEAAARGALALEPASAAGHAALGAALLARGRHADAAAVLRSAAARPPANAEVSYLLGLAETHLANGSAAKAAFEQALACDARLAPAIGGLAVNLVRVARWEEAETVLRLALRHDAANQGLQLNLANVLGQVNKFDESLALYDAILARDAACVDALMNKGFVLYRLEKMDEAIAAFRAALERQEAPDIYSHLGRALLAQGQHDEALAAIRKAGELQEAYRAGALMPMFYNENIPPEEIFAAHRDFSQLIVRPAMAISNAPEPERRLRVGYVSPDFCAHAVALFFKPLLEHHNHERFEIFLFGAVRRADGFTAQLRALADHWVDILPLATEPAAKAVSERGIDVLVDLAGYSENTRIDVLLYRPAPVQVTFLGYPGTTGLPGVEYRLTDAIADPPGRTEVLHTETLVRLPNCFLCYSPPPATVEVSASPAARQGRVTFACFAAFQKMTPRMFALWARILHAVPGSRLMLKRSPLAEGQSPRQRVIEVFAREGVSADRLDLAGGFVSTPEHMTRYAEVDIMLDTQPYSGTTMTCESLWMGVPTVTLAGNSHISRVSASIMTAAGLGELVAQTPDEYVEIATRLAGDVPRLAALRAGLRERMKSSPLMDGKTYAAGVEAAYRDLWRQWCARQKGR